MLQKSLPNVAVRKHSTIKPAQKVCITSSLTDHFLHWQLNKYYKCGQYIQPHGRVASSVFYLCNAITPFYVD